MRSGSHCRIANGCSTTNSSPSAGYEHAHQHPRLAADRQWSTDGDWFAFHPLYRSDLPAWAISNASGYASRHAAFHRLDLQHDRIVPRSRGCRHSGGWSRTSSVSRLGANPDDHHGGSAAVPFSDRNRSRHLRFLGPVLKRRPGSFQDAIRADFVAHKKEGTQEAQEAQEAQEESTLLAPLVLLVFLLL